MRETGVKGVAVVELRRDEGVGKENGGFMVEGRANLRRERIERKERLHTREIWLEKVRPGSNRTPRFLATVDGAIAVLAR